MSHPLLGPDGQPFSTPEPVVFPPETAPNGAESGPKPPNDVSFGGPSTLPASRIVLRCTSEFHGWAEGLADHCSLNLTQAVVQGLIRIAEGSGYHHRIPLRYAPKVSKRRVHPRPTDSHPA